MRSWGDVKRRTDLRSFEWGSSRSVVEGNTQTPRVELVPGHHTVKDLMLLKGLRTVETGDYRVFVPHVFLVFVSLHTTAFQATFRYHTALISLYLSMNNIMNITALL